VDVSNKERIVCGLDIGTTKTCMLLARVSKNQDLEVVGTGYALSSGLNKGNVVDIEAAAACVLKAADEAELKSGVSIDWVTLGHSGDHVQSFNCHGAISIVGKLNQVTPQDMLQVIRAAKAIPMPPGRDILHILPQEFFLDNRGGIQNPVGLTGSRLDVNVHVVTCDEFLKQNLVNAVNCAQMRVRRIVLQQLASAEAVLTPDEKELGVALIDIGGGTTDIVAFLRKSVHHTSVLPIGGDHFTRDIAMGTRMPIEEAERIKKETGTVSDDGIAEDALIQAQVIGKRGMYGIPRRFVCNILRERALDVLELIKADLEDSGIAPHLTAGVVITGGGSMLDGLVGLAEETLGIPVRQGLPQGIQGITEDLSHPVYSAAIGLVMYGVLKDGDQTMQPARAGAMAWFQNRFLSWVSS